MMLLNSLVKSINVKIFSIFHIFTTLSLQVGVKKMAALPLDVTKTNISDVSNVPSLYCTSCTAKEVATSRCSTCHNLLCNNCESAHHYMRCFETHEVVALEDMRKDGIKITVHKPLICDIHPGENVIFYCTSCRVTACAECSKTEHQNHPCEGILDSEVRRQKVQWFFCLRGGMLKCK